MILIGIDPGLTGAIAMIGHRAEYLGCQDMPVIARNGPKAHVKNQVNGAGLAELLRGWLSPYDKNEVHVVLEMPIAFPGQHAAAVAAAFHTAGVIEGVITARGYALTLVRPNEWKKVLKLGKDKNEARAHAVRLFPEASLHRVKDHNRAEALLIAKYGHDLHA